MLLPSSSSPKRPRARGGRQVVRRRHPHREVDRRLRLPLVRQEVPDDRPAGGGGNPLAGGPRNRQKRARQAKPPCSTR